MEDKRNKRQSRLDEYRYVTRKHPRLDSSVNQSEAISSNNDDETGDNSGHDISSNNDDETGDNSGHDISSNNDDETGDNSGHDISSDNDDETGDNSGHARSSNNEDETGNNAGHARSSNNDDEIGDIILDSEDSNINTIKSKFSIFKLANNRLAGLEKIQADMKSFGQCIKQELIEAKMQYRGRKGDTCRPFHLMHFFYSTREKNNATAAQIRKQRKYGKGTGNFPGDRRSGNILVFYRLKRNVPEAFFLCQGIGYNFILYLSDPSFRTRVVKRFMDGEKIKEIETLNITGPDITSTITYKDNCNIAAVSFLERAIVNLSGIIVRNSKLDQLIQRDRRKKETLMEVGINFVRICKSLPCEKWAKVLELFSDEIDDEETEVDGPNCHILNAFEYVRRVEEDKKCRELDKTITEKAIDIIANNQHTSSYYLSHRYIRDWTLSSNVILSEKHTKPKSCDEITSWSSAPTLIMVIEAINRHFKTDSLIEQCLKGYKIVLSYSRETRMKNIPVQDFVHGSVSQDGGQYFKIAQKWFFLASTYSQVIDRNFADMYQCMLVDKTISGLMKYPWRTHKLEITISDCQKFLEVSPDVGEKIIQELTKECKLVEKENDCCLTENSYLLPQSSKLYKELAKKEKGNNTEEKKGKNTKTRKNTPRPKSKSISGNTMGETMNNTPHQDSGIGLDRSMDSSAPVGSITDTQSSSLTMPLPSTSNLASGSGLNTPEVDSDIDQNQTNTSDDENSDKKNKVGKRLYRVLTSDGEINDSGVLSVLQKTKGEICVQEGNKYFVCNPILTEDMMKKIEIIAPSLKEPMLSNFLRCMSPLSEGDYNALYLNYEEDNRFIIFPGDKVLANNVELFDILVYDKEDHTTYLFHNKEGLDHHTRDACAQIRNASELLWHDFVRGQRNHIELFWDSVVNSKTAETPYRYFLKRKLRKLGEDTFMKMFDIHAKIVFVLGFVISRSKASPKLQWKFKPLTLKDFQENGLNEYDKTWLKEEGILTESRYLTDCFIGMTQDKFVEKFKSIDMKTARLKKIHTLLRTKATCKLSTIAKLELLTLNNCFSRYQTGGERHYHLKLLQLDSK